VSASSQTRQAGAPAMMSQNKQDCPTMTDVHLSSGLPETILPPEPEAVRTRLDAATTKAEVAEVVADHPRSLLGWARLGELATDPVEAYAYFRVGYHRGLDALRANGWRGSGYVRWRNETNRGFLRALKGLQATAERIGESDEAGRCAEFLAQLDPGGER
jgi:hypothetical protein